GAVRPDLDADVGVHHALVGDQDLHRWGLPSRKAAASSGWTANSSESRGWPAWPWAILPASGTRPRGLDAPPRHPQRWQRFAVVAAVAPLPAQAVPGADGGPVAVPGDGAAGRPASGRRGARGGLQRRPSLPG